jgi:hypothetical protein
MCFRLSLNTSNRRSFSSKLAYAFFRCFAIHSSNSFVSRSWLSRSSGTYPAMDMSLGWARATSSPTISWHITRMVVTIASEEDFIFIFVTEAAIDRRCFFK